MQIAPESRFARSWALRIELVISSEITEQRSHVHSEGIKWGFPTIGRRRVLCGRCTTCAQRYLNLNPFVSFLGGEWTGFWNGRRGISD